MKIRIYQIDTDRDVNHACFMKLETVLRMQGKLDSSIYDLVYETNVHAKNLEKAYEIFNLEFPEDYRGRSLSVSDIVQIVESTEQKPGFYYCDTFGFKEVDFDLTAVANRLVNTINVLLVRPGKTPVPYRMKNTLTELQNTVGGSIQAVYPYDDPVALICNEDGKIEGLPLNRALRRENGEVYDIVSGNFLIVGIEEDHFCGLVEELMEKYRKLFSHPENFAMVDGDLHVF